MLEAYKGPARMNATEAARLAGYSFPEKLGPYLKKKWAKLFEDAADEYVKQLAVSDEELDAAIANLVRSPNHRDHFKAIELVAKMKGKLDPKITVQMERSGLQAQIDEMIAVVMATKEQVLLPAPVDTPIPEGESNSR